MTDTVEETIKIPDVSKTPSDRGRVGMMGLIAAESAVFTIFVVAYIYYLGKSLTGPAPRDVLHPPIFYSICLLSSSATIHVAVRYLRQGRTALFSFWWCATVLLGGSFLWGTATEWRRLIYEKGLTIHTNLFGTTYYSLVGLHGFHVSVGLLLLFIIVIFAGMGKIKDQHAERLETLSLYWHFVDTVWVVVFTVVYVVGR